MYFCTACLLSPSGNKYFKAKNLNCQYGSKLGTRADFT
jgi:hypothetical protein